MPRARINWKMSGDRPHQIDMTAKIAMPNGFIDVPSCGFL
jgi:hypothetical protein